MGLPPHPSPAVPQGPQSSSDLPGLANPPLEGVRLARLSSVHRVKRSVCPKEPVNTSLSDLLHSTANVKPHYPPPEWCPRPNFHQWSQSLVPVEHCGVPFDAKPPHFWPAAEGFVPDCVRHKAKKLWHSFSNLLRSQPEKDPFWWKWTENAAKIKHRLQPCQLSSTKCHNWIFFSTNSEWFYNNISDTRL